MPRWLAVANLVVWLGLLALVVTQGDQLAWASRALPKLQAGEFEPLVEAELHTASLEALTRGDLDGAQELAERSRAIDPNSGAIVVLGEIALQRGDLEGALAHHRAYLAIDPHFVSGHLRISDLLRRLGRDEERLRHLESATASLRRRARAARVHEDPTVPRVFVEKARKIQSYYRDGTRQLREQLDELRPAPEPRAQSR